MGCSMILSVAAAATAALFVGATLGQRAGNRLLSDHTAQTRDVGSLLRLKS